jgi:hypothetical protein
MDKKRVWGFGLTFATVCVVVGMAFTEASADPFEGTWSADFWEDTHIQDGVQLIHSQGDVTLARVDAQHVTMSGDGTSATMVQQEDVLQLENRPLDVGFQYWLDSWVMSDGTNGAGVLAFQHYGDPADIGVSVCVWTNSTDAVLATDLVGRWQFDFISHWNLRNIHTESFRRESMSVDISYLSDEQLGVTVVGAPDYTWVLELNGNRLSMVSGHPYAVDHCFELATDGRTMSFVNITSETYDPTDVSATIGLGVIPEPATLSLLALGGLAVLGRRRR